MKKIFLTLMLLLSFGFSQSVKAIDVDWGITAGMNFIKLHGDHDDIFSISKKNHAGWFLGGKINLNFPSNFGIESSLVYSQSRLTFNDTKNYTVDETYRCFEIPLNLKYTFDLTRSFSLYAVTGPRFCFSLGDRSVNFHNTTGSFKHDNMNTSWDVGVGTRMWYHADVAVVYNFGFGSVGKSIFGAKEYDADRRNSIKLQFTYYF